ncbi:MAG TPA: hypothetical protein VIU40_04365 [Geobacteraceae bacterium]
MSVYLPLQQLPDPAGYGAGDVFILCGELFGRGYANGIVEEAKARGMTIIGTTVGRREGDGTLRPLTAEELAEAEANLGGRIINIPLEAGFDMEPGPEGRSVSEILKGVKPDGWDQPLFSDAFIAAVRTAGTRRFTANLARVAAELEKLVPTGVNVLITHSMAGGIPRARVLMPLLNRVFKGQGEKYLSSAAFWASDLGKVCAASFDEVTADTFRYLMEATAGLRSQANVRYIAYGYHGCEVLVDGAYTWQTYTPYLQGWAKVRLEDHARAARAAGTAATVFNCPEIQTNSSALFLGVEISLYPILAAFDREGGGPAAEALKADCRRALADGVSLEGLLARANDYLAAPLMRPFYDLAGWPLHSTREQMEFMLAASAELLAMGRDPKEPICAILSQAVFTGVGKLMLETSFATTEPVFWLNHNIIARRLLAAS